MAGVAALLVTNFFMNRVRPLSISSQMTRDHEEREQGGRDDAADDGRPSGARNCAPSPEPSATGIMPAMSANVVIRIGRRRIAPGLDERLRGGQPLLLRPLGEVDQQDRVLRHDAHQQDHADDGHDVDRAPVTHSAEHHADERQRERHQDGERVEERAELEHEDEVHQHHALRRARAACCRRPPAAPRVCPPCRPHAVCPAGSRALAVELAVDLRDHLPRARSRGRRSRRR